jgi:hypothetical protein
MANEEVANDVGHLTRQDMLDLVLNKGLREEPAPAFKNKGEENFAAKDKIVNLLDRKIRAEIEVDELATYDI